MKKKLLVAIMVIVSVLCMGCEKEKEKTKNKTSLGELEGVLDFYYYFNDDGIYVTNSDRIMYSEWDNIEFDYICMDPVCMHTEDSCTAYAIDDEERREDRYTFSVAYNDKLVIFEKYNTYEAEEITEKTTKYKSKYYIDVYEAESDGSNRKLMTTVEGTTDSNIMYKGVIVYKGKVWFGGVKESETISELIKGDIGEGYLEEKINYSDAIYSVDLTDYTVEEYGLEEGKKCEFDAISFLIDQDNVYAIKKCMTSKKMSVYKIGEKSCELLFEENGSEKFIIGLLGDRLYYADEKNLYFRNTSNADKRQVLEVDGAENTINSYVVGDKLVVLTHAQWEGDIIKKCEYTFYSADGKEIAKQSYDEYFTFFEVIGDRVIYIKPFSTEQVWWNDIDKLENIFDGATYIGASIIEEHDKLD